MEQQFSAGGVVIRNIDNDMKVLLIKDRFGHWTWPKGHIERGETPEEAALREITEETGLNDLEIKLEIAEQEYIFEHNKNPVQKKVNIFLIENRSKEKLVANVPELLEAEWFSPDRSMEKIDYEGARDILGKAIHEFKKLVSG